MTNSSGALKTPPPGYSASSISTSSAEKMLPQPDTALATTAKPSKIKYRPLTRISHHETLRYYRPGGYHPILINDSLGEAGRFKVLRKLGYGTFGTVWMCWDRNGGRLRAVKVMQADESEENYEQEVWLLERLSKGDDQVSVEEAYKNHLGVPLEHFWQDGPNGRHLCIVMPVLGPNVMKAKALGDVDFLKNVCSQVTSGLAFLHSKGMAHGDLHPGNILFQTDLSDLKLDEVETLLERYNYEPLSAEGHDGPGPHAPKHIYESFNWDEVNTKYIKKEIAIIDFGTSFKTSAPPNYPTIDASMRAPEQFFQVRPSQASDLWALGCTLMHILGSNNPFKRYPTVKTWSPVPRWEEALGPLPEPYRANWIASKGAKRKRKYEEVDTSEPVSVSSERLAKAKRCRLEEWGIEDVISAFLAKPTPLLVPASAHQQQQKMGASEGSDSDSDSDLQQYIMWSLPRQELAAAVSLVRSVFKYNASDRTPAKDLLDHPFFTRHNSSPLPPPPPAASQTQDHSPERTSPAAKAAGTP